MDETFPFGANSEVDLVSPSKSPPKKKQLWGRTPSPVAGHSTAVPERENSVESLSFAVSEVKMAAEYLFESETGKRDWYPPS